jgi:ABC-type transport system involved in cytochrome bd biosynthesis fused ATPase/permease subunit
MKPSFTIFRNNWINATLLITFLQQMLVAGGTFFLGHLANLYPTEGFQLSSAIILFICILLPGTIIHYWVVWCTTRAYKSAQLNYLNEYIESNYNHPTHWRDEKSKQQRHDMMCRGGQETIQSAVYFLVDFTATGLNILLNTISIILVTDLTLGLIIIVAGLLGLWMIHLFGTSIAESSRNEILADNQLNAHLSRSWDNIILGNQLFFDRWKNHFVQLFSNTENASLQNVRKRDWAVSMAGMVTNALVLGGALFLAWMYKDTAGFVLAILVMLPRSLQIVMHIQIIQKYVAQWKDLQEKLAVTYDSLAEPQYIDLRPLIQQDHVRVRVGNQNYSPQDIENCLGKNRSGRFTITGPNGVGKSNLLLELKNKFNLSAAYLPAHHQLMLQQSQLSLSTGETALAALKDLGSANCDVLLLDEWDANLSPENRTIIDKVIDQLSLKRIIIEVRHSTENPTSSSCALK